MLSRAAGGRVVEEDIIIESDVRERKNKQRHGGPRRRSLSVPRRTPHAPHESYDTTEIDYSRRRETGRGRDKSSQEWAIVDVPDASRGGQRDVGGGGGVSSHEISLQRTNGVRRSKITIDKEEYMAGPSASQPRKTKEREMWTEITKDLVVKQAIETMGYDYEETEYFFYVMDYLRYVRASCWGASLVV